MKKLFLLAVLGALLIGGLCAEPKRLTLKFLNYREEGLDVVLGVDGGSSWSDARWDYTAEPVSGFGLDYAVYNNNRHTELLLGFNYMLERHLSSVYSPSSYRRSDDDGETALNKSNTMQVTSLYVCSRVF